MLDFYIENFAILFEKVNSLSNNSKQKIIENINITEE